MVLVIYHTKVVALADLFSQSSVMQYQRTASILVKPRSSSAKTQ